MIYLLRHGEIESPGGKRFIGQVDCPLSDRGRSQADFWKNWLTGKGIGSIFCSDLCRSLDTADIIARGIGGKCLVKPELREIHLGEWDGQSMQQIKTDHPAVWKARGEHIDTFKTPGGESFSDLYDRVVPLFRSIAVGPDGHVLIVGHAGVNRMILCSVLGMPIRNLFSIQQHYGAMNIIDNAKTGLKIVSINIPAGTGNGLS